MSSVVSRHGATRDRLLPAVAAGPGGDAGRPVGVLLAIRRRGRRQIADLLADWAFNFNCYRVDYAARPLLELHFAGIVHSDITNHKSEVN